jgi:hypothetical protein
MPRSSIQRQEFGSKKPYLIASVFAVAAAVFAIYIAEQRIGNIWKDRLDEATVPLGALTQQSQKLQSAISERDQLKKQADQLKDLADTRFSWINVLSAIRGALLQAEIAEKTNLFTPDNGGTNTDVGIWIEDFSPVLASGSPFSAGAEAASGGGGGGGGGDGMSRYRSMGRRYPGMANRYQQPSQVAAPVVATSGDEITDMTLQCRGVNRNLVAPTANMDLAILVKQNLTNNPAFKQADVSGDVRVDESNTNTFTFSLTLKLTHPIKL